MSNILDLAVPATETVTSVNILIHGDSGSGKTTFAGSGRDNGQRDLILAIENGTVSAARSGSQANVLQIGTWDELNQAIDAIVDDPDRFEWVIVDSITKLQDLIWDHILSEAVGRNPSRSRYKKELQEYGEAQARLAEVVERLNNSDANILWTALSDLEVDEQGNEFKMPSIHGRGGKQAAWVCAQMDTVIYLSVIEHNGRLRRRFQFNKTPEAYAKDRLQTFQKAQGDLTLAKLTDKIVGAGEEDNNDNETKEN